MFNLLLLTITTFLTTLSLVQSQAQNNTAPCPLDFNVLRNLTSAGSKRPPTSDINQQCQYIRQGLRLVQSHYLQLNNSFLPPLDSAESCWRTYQVLIDEFLPNLDIRSSCGFNTSWISQGCMNISTRSQFEAIVPVSALNDAASNCNQSLENNSPCAACTTSLSTLQARYLKGTSIGNVSDCQAYPSIYAAAFTNRYGPTDKGTAKCLFLLDFISKKSSKKRSKVLILGVLLGCGVGLVVLIGLCWIFHKRKKSAGRVLETELGSGLESISQSTSLVKYTYDEIRMATRNFSRDNIIGRGGYGNVYKGELPDGSLVAFKRFKNCSAAGDASFAHEVEVIASVRHVNLVALRGYCIATSPLEGHQRIIVSDLINNGTLHDHLFGSSAGKLSWPIRQKIALGTARGLAYLHHGTRPSIVHRDIKASNILLDESFEPKVADFGLAKFTPERMTLRSTRVVGTVGYVAPEYTSEGQLTLKSDVFSFGVVLLELLSGKKALMGDLEGQQSILTEWAWSLVREGRTLEVIEDGMPEPGSPEILEKHVLVAVLCSHPQLYARPRMDEVVKMLETDFSIPSIPEKANFSG
ncbi:PREDICTED: probable LRR receptor-like serine/threonine-protein kinase RKF3 isoform X2 [Populus euphratica]|uniref:non-specific serine/threonine protein kinase n=1 Tax=Populus euphratica TaxID=75702 RepID=A0AAJ6XWB2_POPEU|nr:PREDICTED: probable LRR receptor-like serine/threonine-protein kinase RKF3 isoform X2 [Populus euphratica]